ncbi:MAG TPA: hypothetical protein VHH36_00005, partial [Candidatus Thermoplasmatota archaeon]|nr:hypothetical protein [Candidatus Thermoplasmatota archaeon]
MQRLGLAHKVALGAAALAVVAGFAPWAELEDASGTTHVILGSEMAVRGVPGGSATVVAAVAVAAAALLLLVRRPGLRGALAALVFGLLAVYAVRHLLD